jgi:two-component system, sensor histidine kinase PdtaS
MATTASELAQEHAQLSTVELGHLLRLLGSWGLLADLSFSDLLLLVPATREVDGKQQTEGKLEHGPASMVVLGQMRPSNRPTLLEQDLVGQEVPEPVLRAAVRALDGDIVRGSIHFPQPDALVEVESVPVRVLRRVVAVLVRLSPSVSRPVSLFERTYIHVFERLATMVAESEFPFPGEDVATEETPRVGDGFVVVAADGRIEFASPNAMNAMHRMGVFNDPEGETFSELGVDATAIKWALATGRPVVEEVERRPDVIVLLHCIPLLARGRLTGSMILMRDVTDVRRLDRLLLSKDAAIREVHHRVKNNLQTISSLLSLQARRVAVGEGREALREAERRVRSIGLVHEILSREPADQVPFDEIVESLVQMAEDSVVSSRPVEIDVMGDLGAVSADVATPLAVTLAELLQNAVHHAFGPPAEGRRRSRGGSGEPPGHVWVTLQEVEDELLVEVRDDGRGLPESFDLAERTSLGLLIVRDLVQGQLGGTIALSAVPPHEGGGTRANIVVPPRRD